MKLTLCIAAFNEEKFIRYPLDSACGLADEVILVDGGSDDKTVEIARSYGQKVTVINEKNPPMFHKNKQIALDHAKGEWILQLDADEAVSDELKAEIKQLLDKTAAGGRPEFDAYWIPRKNFFLTKFLTKGGQYPDYTIRLYKNGAAHFPCQTVHENVEVKGQTGYLQSPILHYMDPDFNRYLARWNRYTGLDADMLVKEGKKPRAFSYFIFKPLGWFFSTYVRHRGYVDGFPGFIFCLFSSIRFWAVYVKWWQAKQHH